MKKFEMWREKQITMLRHFDEENGECEQIITSYFNEQEFIVNEPPPSVTPENIREAIVTSPTVPIPEPTL